MRLGILTGGGDAPGLNAVIRGFVLRAHQLGHTVVGIRRGWRGVRDADTVPLGPTEVDGIHRSGGTLLKTSRTNPFKDEATRQETLAGLRRLKLDVLVAAGGDDTLGACAKLSAQGVPAIGIPKTIDNDLTGTDVTFGFDTAANITMEALDRLHTTADSHERCLVVEIMGRHAGWIAWAAGLAGGAHVVLVPEEPFDIQDVAEVVRSRDKAGHGYTLIAVAEGAVPKGGAAALQTGDKDAFGNVRLGGIAEQVAKQIEALTKKETRHVVLGHLQRGGAPSAIDRVLGTRLGIAAADLAHEKRFGVMVAVRGTRIEPVPLGEAAKGYRTLTGSELSTLRVVRGA